jgi:hypothetical protein
MIVIASFYGLFALMGGSILLVPKILTTSIPEILATPA